jgi:hypothetical protein
VALFEYDAQGADPMTRKKEREAAYLNQHAGLGHLSFDLIVSAKQTLMRALHDRQGDVVRLATTHYTPNAAATIVLVTTALDVSMNEAIAMGSVFGGNIERGLALPATCAKFANVASRSDGFDPAATELRTLVDLRDEIVHYLPRTEQSATGNVPNWCHALQAQGLFLEAPGSDFQFSQKIPSYALAYWSYDVAFRAIELFVGSLPETAQNVCEYLVHNFSVYQSICRPEELRAYDAEHLLKLTEFDSQPSQRR